MVTVIDVVDWLAAGEEQAARTFAFVYLLV